MGHLSSATLIEEATGSRALIIGITENFSQGLVPCQAPREVNDTHTSPNPHDLCSGCHSYPIFTEEKNLQAPIQPQKPGNIGVSSTRVFGY